MNGPYAGYRAVPAETAGPAARRWWDENASEYLLEHGEFLGDADFVWCPEGLREQEAHLLGPVRGKQVLEVGAGAAQCSRWLRRNGADAVASDISAGMLSAGMGAGRTGNQPSVVQADARALPFAAAGFDIVFTSYGALPFIPDIARVHGEVARVLRPGGRWVFSVTHPIRWAFPDDPSQLGLTAVKSYFDRTPYVETDDDGRISYAEYHHTLGDHIRALAAVGFRLLDLVEPEWPPGHDRVWGGWSPTRGQILPGTAIFVAENDSATR